MLRDKSLLLTGKHFTAPDEDGMRKTFIAIVLEQDAADPTLSMYRQVETDLKSAVKDIEHFKQMLKEGGCSSAYWSIASRYSRRLPTCVRLSIMHRFCVQG
jgi:hypothetical protein